MRRRSVLKAVALFAMLSLVAAACGDDDDGDETAATTTTAGETAETTTTSGPELTGEPVKVMAIYEKTAGVAVPEIGEGVQAAVDALNGRGGVQGRPLEYVECDTQNDPNTAAECGRQAVSEGVVAIVGSLSVHSGEFMPTLADAGIASIGLVPAGAADFTSPNAYPIYGGLVTAVAALGRNLVDQGATTLAVVRIDLPAAAVIANFVNSALTDKGITVTNDVAVPQGAPDMSTYAAAALEGGVDGVVLGVTGQDATNFIIAAKQANPDIKIALTATDLIDALRSLGDEATEIYATSGYVQANMDLPAVEQYLEDMEAAGITDPSKTFHMNAYASVLLLAEIAEGLATIDAAGVSATLPTIDGLSIGLTPPLQFVEGGVGGIPRIFNPCQLQLAWDTAEGEFVAIDGTFIDAFSGEACPAP
ncbi:MAG: ABC transporter substrate-binding protein [Acidimicrobiia bacterium]|nr:ABC transporter substrate-binding protein [Acidimicrobiia bacterium]